MVFRKALSLVLLFSFLFNIMGYYVLFNIIKSQVRSEIRNEISSESSQKKVVTLIISSEKYHKDVIWQSGDEFSMDDKLYDVIHIDERNGQFYISCLKDDQEERINQSFKNSFSHENRLIASFFLQMIHDLIPEVKNHQYFSQDFIGRIFRNHENDIILMPLMPLTPPPKHA